MEDQWNLDVLGRDKIGRRNAVKTSAGIHLRNAGRAEYGQSAAHAEAAHSHFLRGLLQILRGAAKILLRGIEKVEAGHQMIGLVGGGSYFAAKQIRDQRA